MADRIADRWKLRCEGSDPSSYLLNAAHTFCDLVLHTELCLDTD
jgi:hypothetical protein